MEFYELEDSIRNTKQVCPRSVKKLEWNVILESNNQYGGYNIFTNLRFINQLKKCVAPSRTFDKFAKATRKALMYCFWAKCEYEVIITCWPPCISVKEIERMNKEIKEHQKKWKYKPNACTPNLEGIKLDIYMQVLMNWNNFISYLWKNRKLIRKLKK